MNSIDPRAIIDPSAKLAEGVEVGPWSIVGPDVEIGEGTVIGPHVVLKGSTRIGKLTIRNRVLSTAHAEVYATDGGMTTDRYVKYYEEKAKGGIGLAICGGSSSVAIDSPQGWWKSSSGTSCKRLCRRQLMLLLTTIRLSQAPNDESPLYPLSSRKALKNDSCSTSSASA